MKRILEDVVPVGTPWGGPESMKNLSCFTSMLMCIEEVAGSENELRRKHEWFYNVYLAITGVGVTTRWSERYRGIFNGSTGKHSGKSNESSNPMNGWYYCVMSMCCSAKQREQCLLHWSL